MTWRKKRRIGAFSKRLTFSDLDRRTNAGKYVNAIKNDLEAQIGNPSPGQQMLIKLVAIKMLRCEMMYERVLSQPDGVDLQERVENYFLAWSNSVRRDLEALGVPESARSNIVPPLGLGSVQIRPPFRKIFVRQIERPTPMPLAFVETNG